MKIRLNFPPGTKVIPVEGSAAIEIEPFFSARRGSTVVAHGESTSVNGDVLDGFVLSVSAVTGRTGLQRRPDESVTPLVDVPSEEREELDEEGTDAEVPDEEEEEPTHGRASGSKHS